MSNSFELTDEFISGLAERLMRELRTVCMMVCEDYCLDGGDFLECTSSEVVFRRAGAAVVSVFGHTVEVTIRNYFTAHREAALTLFGKEVL